MSEVDADYTMTGHPPSNTKENMEHTLNDTPTAKAISPKVSLPLILGVIALAAQTAATQSWDEASWLGSGLIVLYAVVGYLVNDPARVTE